MIVRVDVNAEVWKAFKILAIQRNTTVADLLATLVEQEVKATSKP